MAFIPFSQKGAHIFSKTLFNGINVSLNKLKT
jgi:hypothetical protein